VHRQQGDPEIECINGDEGLSLQALVVVQDIEVIVERVLEKGIDIQQTLPAVIEKDWVGIEPPQGN